MVTTSKRRLLTVVLQAHDEVIEVVRYVIRDWKAAAAR